MWQTVSLITGSDGPVTHRPAFLRDGHDLETTHGRWAVWMERMPD
jgi:hypothetical protein